MLRFRVRLRLRFRVRIRFRVRVRVRIMGSVFYIPLCTCPAQMQWLTFPPKG